MHLWKRVFIFAFLAALAVPYLIHPAQDLPAPVIHDEATHHINAKDTVFFGPAFLKENRNHFIVLPLCNLLGIISFFLFGNSLFSLRFPYIIINIIGNILFFDLIRRSRGNFIGLIMTAAFALYAPRIIIGKSAMAESLVIPLIIILLWVMAYTWKRRSSYFWMGFFGVLIFIAKLDNLFVLAFVTMVISMEAIYRWVKKDAAGAKEILKFYLLGLNAVILPLLLFYTVIGWDRVIIQFAYNILPTLNKAPWWPSSPFTPLTIRLFMRNVDSFYINTIYSGYFMVILTCLLPFIILILRSREERNSPLSWGIYLLLFLWLGKLFSSVFAYERRFSVFYPLPFLLIAHIAGFSWCKYKPLVLKISSRLEKINYKIIVAIAGFPILIFIFILISVCYLPNMPIQTKQIIFSPTYNKLKEAKMMSGILDRRYKVLMLDGVFGYLNIQLPNKFVYIPPNLKEYGFIMTETNPDFIMERLLSDTLIRYVLVQKSNVVIRKILEQEFQTRLILDNVSDGYGCLYEIKR